MKGYLNSEKIIYEKHDETLRIINKCIEIFEYIEVRQD